MGSSSSDIRAGRAYVELYGKTDPLVQDLKKTEPIMQRWGESLAKIGAGIAAAGAAIRGPMLAAAHMFSDVGSDLMKMSRETGISVEALSELKYAASQSNISLEKAVELARSGQNNFAGLRAEARRLGVTMTGGDAKAADDLRRALSAMYDILKSITVNIGAAVAPALTHTVRMLRDWSATAAHWIKTHRPAIALFSKIGTVLFFAGTALAFVGTAMSGVTAAAIFLMTAIGTAATVVSTLATPLGAAIAAAVALTAAFAAGLVIFLRYTATGQAAVRALAAELAWLKQIALDTFQGIVDAMKSGDLQLAAKIMWVGLKVAWLEGTRDLYKIWLDMVYGLAGVFFTLIKFVKNGFAEAQALAGLLTPDALDKRKQQNQAEEDKNREALGEGKDGRAAEMEKEIARLKAELNRLIGRAAQQARLKKYDDTGEPIIGAIGGLGNANTVGTFSAAAVSGISGGGIGQKIDTTNDLLRQQNIWLRKAAEAGFI